MSIRNINKNRILPVLVFIGGVLVYLLAVLPFLIYRKGLFFYYGDYNVQQVPFLIFAHRAVRQGRFFWNPLVDLGGNMTGSFAFYLWGSPFFWLTIPFPENWLPYMTPYLMALKFGTASAAAFAWIRTQTRSDKAAAAGAFLYAFSGFQACNIVFQHFHDVTAFFPLYLLAFDRFVVKSREVCEKHRRGRKQGDSTQDAAQDAQTAQFARTAQAGSPAAGVPDLLGFPLMTALMSVINYYFFFGQVLFFVLYYLVRWGIRRARGSGLASLAAEILRILAAGMSGLMLSAVFLVQSIGGILGNTRVSRIVNGYDLVTYPDAGTPLAILKSFFMVPDLIARGTLFTNDNIRNGSLAFFLPCFAMSGVFAFWMMRRRSWKKTLLTVLAVMAFVPVLNAAFSAFNSNFYTRWFYMPILLCACMTAEVLEERDSAAFRRGALLSTACTAFFLVCCFLPVEDKGQWSFTSISENRNLLDREITGTLINVAALILIVLIMRRCGSLFTEGSRRIPGIVCLLLTIACCVVSTYTVLDNGSSLISYTGFQKWQRQMLSQGPLLGPASGTGGSPAAAADQPVSAGAESDPEDSAAADENTGTTSGPVPGVDAPFSRVETDGTCTNYEMVWGYPTMHCFESTVHPSIFEWYRGIGMIRTVESTLPFERIGARAVMSVRYYIENTLVSHEDSYTDQKGIDGYSLLNDLNGYNVYETENYIPMGFSFDSYMTEENYDILRNGVVSDRVLAKNIILSEEMADKYGDLMEEDTDTYPGEMTYGEFADHCDDRAASACSEFGFDKNGWHAKAEMEKDNLLLFSIPYDSGFSAMIDGKPAEVERADFALTAIFVPEGRHEIVVTYLPPGLVPAAAVSALTAAAMLIFALFIAARQSGSARR